jgi:hypothetical protein
MAGIWGVCCHWRKNGYCHFPDPDLVYLYLLSHYGISFDRLFYFGLLDEYQKVYPIRPPEPHEISLTGLYPLHNLLRNLTEISVPCSSSITPILTMGS